MFDALKGEPKKDSSRSKSADYKDNKKYKSKVKKDKNKIG